MKKKDKLELLFYSLAVVLGVVWLLAMTWSPFGNPLPIWHFVNGLLFVGALALGNKPELIWTGLGN